jgi:hypothetical protein
MVGPRLSVLHPHVGSRSYIRSSGIAGVVSTMVESHRERVTREKVEAVQEKELLKYLREAIGSMSATVERLEALADEREGSHAGPDAP